jgi:hypothetical protein
LIVLLLREMQEVDVTVGRSNETETKGRTMKSGVDRSGANRDNESEVVVLAIIIIELVVTANKIVAKVKAAT